MDSAKNKKLFPELSPLPSGVSLGGLTDMGGRAPAPARPRFSMTSAFWETLERDADVKREFEERVERRAKQLIDSEAGPQKAAIFEGARQQGFDEGMAQARENATAVLKELEAITAGLIQEKQNLLHGHERLWCQAIEHLCHRFLIPLTPERLSGLTRWLEDAVGDLSRQGKIRVVLSPSSLDRLRTQALQPTGPWEWAEDRTLADGQLRVELVGGGLLFCPEIEAEKLTDKLSQILGANANSL